MDPKSSKRKIRIGGKKGAVLDWERDRLPAMIILDADGVRLPRHIFRVDLETGEYSSYIPMDSPDGDYPNPQFCVRNGELMVEHGIAKAPVVAYRNT